MSRGGGFLINNKNIYTATKKGVYKNGELVKPKPKEEKMSRKHKHATIGAPSFDCEDGYCLQENIASMKPKEIREWEKEFDKKFNSVGENGNDGNFYIRSSEVKDFISNLLKEERIRTLERVEKYDLCF